ncbi:MAG: PepSY domain-containing protein [Idiomarina sp.]|nr:PepSY domain-containing protein [Idiomarina sp.]
MARVNLRKLHRWIGLVLLVQISIWAVSGAYMVWVKLPYIHGTHLGTLDPQPVPSLSPDALLNVQARYPQAQRLDWFQPQLLSHPEPLVRVQLQGHRLLVSPASLTRVRPTQSDIEHLAQRAYQANDTPEIRSVNYLTEAPGELNAAHLPVWRVDFRDRVATTLYFSADTGELVTRRFVWWRVFDIMWMLHIMDYEDRHDITKPWLQALSILSILFVVTGFIMLWRRFKPSGRRRSRL